MPGNPASRAGPVTSSPLQSSTPVTGLVLAGGGSRRMGREKALIEHEGVPLVHHVAGRLGTLCAEVLVASGRPGRLGSLPWPEVADAEPGAGPLGGLIAGLEAARNGLVAVVAVDMPDVDPHVLRRLVRLRDGEDVVMPVVDDRPQPLHAVYAAGTAHRLRTAFEAGERSLTAAVQMLTVRYVGPDGWSDLDPRASFTRNLNRPQDLLR